VPPKGNNKKRENNVLSHAYFKLNMAFYKSASKRNENAKVNDKQKMSLKDTEH
jgi:hypothetical protein